jgi:hypothetical protein
MELLLRLLPPPVCRKDIKKIEIEKEQQLTEQTTV